MSKFVKWVTLTPEEKQLVGGGSRANTEGHSPTGIVKAQNLRVTMPDGSECAVEYTRYGAKAHRFAFMTPICQRLWHDKSLPAGEEGIQEKANQLAVEAFRLAQQDEQKEMRRKSVPPGHKKSNAYQLRAETVEKQAGLYAICLKLNRGTLLPLSHLYAEPEKAVAAWQEGRHESVVLQPGQQIVIGICCRYARCWKQARFIASPDKSEEAEERQTEPEVGENEQEVREIEETASEQDTTGNESSDHEERVTGEDKSRQQKRKTVKRKEKTSVTE